MRRYTNLVARLKKSRSIVIIGHQNADPDALCSAYALGTLARHVNRKLKIAFASPDGVSKVSNQILQTLPLKVSESLTLSDVDLIITVDTNTVQQLGGFKEPILQSGKPLVMIDHHAPHPENAKLAALVLCDDKSTSTCELVLDMFRELRVKLNRSVSQALLVGLLVETGHLSIGTRRTFQSACRLVEAGADPESALSLIRMPMDESERIARIKTAQRLRLERIGKWLVALSEVGSYHASAARALVAVGAHLAVVAGKRNDQLTVSFRSTHDFFAETGFHVGTDLAKPLGEKMDGMGGGHATAAGANVKGEPRQALQLSLELARNFLAARKPNTPSEGYAGASSQNEVITQK